MATIDSNRLFLLNTLGPLINNPSFTPSKIYAFYHNKIGEKQAAQAKQLQFAFNILDQAGRKIDITTDDPVLIQKKREQLALLASIEKEMRETMFNEDAKFMDALRTILNYKF